MSATRRRVDLASLINADSPVTAETPPPPLHGTGTRAVPIEKIAANPMNTRNLDRSADTIDELGRSMARIGQMESCAAVTRKAFLAIFPELAGAIGDAELVQVSGGRRRLAAIRHNIPTLDVTVKDAIAVSRLDFLAATALENIEREDLDPIEEAQALQLLADEADSNQSRVAEKMYRTRQWVSQRIGLLRLVPPLQELVRCQQMPIGVARQLSTREPGEQEAMWAVLQQQRDAPPAGPDQPAQDQSQEQPQDRPAAGPGEGPAGQRAAPAVAAIRRLGGTPQRIGENLVTHVERQDLLELWTYLKNHLGL